MDLSDLAWTMAADILPLPKNRARVERKMQSGECLCCNQKTHRRGLCTKHYYEWWKQKLETPKEKRGMVEKKRIRQGTLLSDRQGQGGGRPKKQQELAQR